MRIISGSRRGIKLVEFINNATRPTLDRVKESLFNILENNIDFNDIKVLDLFSGTGNLGLEALSRGAKYCVFNDSNKKAIEIINKNIIKCMFSKESKIENMDYKTILTKYTNSKFDLIFIDPPYNEMFIYDCLYMIKNENVLNKNGIIIFETDKLFNDIEINNQYNIFDKREYGRAKLIFMKDGVI